MINFRYHVVSLTSVFLALAIGLVLGTTALNGLVVDNLNERVTELGNTNDQYRDRITELEQALESREDYVQQVAVSTLADTMSSKKIVLIEGPDASVNTRKSMISMLGHGGARVIGTVRLTQSFTDPQRAEALHDLATQATVPGTQLPESGEGIVTASSLLAQTLLVQDDVTEDDRTSVLQAFLAAGFITIEGSVSGVAEGVIFLQGPTSTQRDAEERSEAVVEITRQLADVTDVCVAAAPSAGSSGDPLVEIRGDSGLAERVSTVDGVSTEEGRLAAAMALVQQFQGEAGAYGTGEGAQARVPAIR